MAGRLSATIASQLAASLLLSASFSATGLAAEPANEFLNAPKRNYFSNETPAQAVAYTTPGWNGPCNCCPTPGTGVPADGNAPSPSDNTPLANQPMDPGAGQPEQFAGLGSNSFTVNDAVGGYIDNPIVGTWFRLRYDDADKNVFPDRAEFFYAKCGGLGGPGPGNGSCANRVDYREIAPYFEYQMAPRTSVFVELPSRQVDLTMVGVPNQTNTGFSDMNAGFKYALYVDSAQYLTFQFRTYIPTGNASQGLGTNHVSLEPGLLYLGRLSNRSYIQGEARQWVPVGGTDFAGNVFRWGTGFGYDIYRTFDNMDVRQIYGAANGMRITSVTEVVGWYVSGGQKTDSDAGVAISSNRDTIVNIKQGARITWGPRSVYAGWGHALTTEAWYRDLFRLEYRRMF